MHYDEVKLNLTGLTMGAGVVGLPVVMLVSGRVNTKFFQKMSGRQSLAFCLPSRTGVGLCNAQVRRGLSSEVREQNRSYSTVKKNRSHFFTLYYDLSFSPK